MPAHRLRETLIRWEASNPLVRNVFIWAPGRGLTHPRLEGGATREERRFAARFDPLFSGRAPWTRGVEEMVADVMAPTGGRTPVVRGLETLRRSAPANPAKDVRQLQIIRQSLMDLAKGKVANGDSKRGGEKKKDEPTEGWIPWFAENRLHLLGWVRSSAEGPIHGMELEVMALLSRLIPAFPETAPKGAVYVIEDGAGRILHQAGRGTPAADARPLAMASLEPLMPHWRVVIRPTADHQDASVGREYVILTGLLLAIFLAAILLGGGLLTWQVSRNLRDARQKTSFVSNVSHELKTPLTSIRMYAELLKSGRITDPDKRSRYLQVIVAESQRLTRLVNNVLDFSRLEQGGKSYNLTELDLGDFLNDLLEEHRPRVEKAGMALTVQLPGRPVLVKTDRDAMEQVMLNLIDNAIKYAAGGKTLDAALEIRGDKCEARIMDRGPGVLAAHRTRIFHQFHRVDDSLTASQPGSGLGLSIARRLLTDLGGAIVHEPREGGGSCFIVTIPQIVNSQ
ncbi:MAG: HAMP domain-containing histidine kinase [Desulfobacterales bacterium]|nr:HAMP domain-containing histidine kinase [Desulfobacterales bacterium]